PALLAHWTRMHRTLALSATVALVVGLASAVLYVRRIATERDRADAALLQAEAARRTAITANAATEEALAARTLAHAALLVSSDPSAAVNVLATYKGTDLRRRNMLRTEADGRGVARMSAAPHTRPVLWIHGLADQSVATQAGDGTIAVTSLAGAVTVIA